jgi:hypothetical protein
VASPTPYTSTIVIQELASGSGSPRIVTLVGSALPFMGAEWGMKSNVITTWYPGNGQEATQQVLGPQELPSRWSGNWARTLMGRSPVGYVDDTGAPLQIVDPNDLREVLEQISRAGQRLRVTWSQLSAAKSAQGTIVREGRMTELKFKYLRLQDISWDIQFDWMSRGSKGGQHVTSTRANTVVNNSAAYLNAILKLQAANTAASLAYLNPKALTLGQIEALANTPTVLANSIARSLQEIVSNATQVVALAQTIASQPVQIANRAVDLARDTVSQVNAMYDTLSQIPYESMSTKSKVADLVTAWSTFGQQSDLAQGAARSAQQFSTQLEASVQAYIQGHKNTSKLSSPQNVDQVYICKLGDTPGSISQRFFGTPDRAVDILKTNGLSWYTPVLPPGKILLIPILQSTDPTQGV